MDLSIKVATPAMHRERGAAAFDRGARIDEHHMNPGSPAILDWQRGWKQRQLESMRAGQNTPPARRRFDAGQVAA